MTSGMYQAGQRDSVAAGFPRGKGHEPPMGNIPLEKIKVYEYKNTKSVHVKNI